MNKNTMAFEPWDWESENWGGDPEGKLAKALEAARNKNEGRKPLKIKKLSNKVRTLSGDPHIPRELVKDKNITPEEMANRTKVEAESFEADMTKQGKDFVSKKIATIMRDWKKTGKIGNSTPKDAKAAQQQAIAVAFSMAARKGFKGVKKGAESFESDGYFRTKPTCKCEGEMQWDNVRKAWFCMVCPYNQYQKKEAEDCSCEIPKPRHVGVHPITCKGCNLIIVETDFNADADLRRNYDAINIEWDTDGEEVDLPLRVSIPNSIVLDGDIAGYLTDEYGWFVTGFELNAEGLKSIGGCIKCGGDVVNVWVENGIEKPLCKDCYVMHFYSESFDSHSGSYICNDCGCLNSSASTCGGCGSNNLAIIVMGAEDTNKITIDDYIPKRVEGFQDTILFYIGEYAERRYSHPWAIKEGLIERKILPNSKNPQSIIDPEGISISDIEMILGREWDGRYYLFEEGGTFVGGESHYFSADEYDVDVRDIWTPEREVIEQIKYDSRLKDEFPLIDKDSYWDSTKINEWTPERQTIEEIRGNREYREMFPMLGRHPGHYDNSGWWVEDEDEYREDYTNYQLPVWAQILVACGASLGFVYLAKKLDNNQ